MPEKLSYQTFAPHLKTPFIVRDGDAFVRLELIEATEVRDNPRMEQFSIIFRGPQVPQLTQRIHLLEHDQLGKIEMFLVPIGSMFDAEGLCYQSVFNRFRNVSV